MSKSHLMRAGAVAASVLLTAGSDGRAEPFTLVVVTRTSALNNAGTNDPIYLTLHYLERNEDGDKPKGKAKKPVLKGLTKRLDKPGDDFRTGATDTFRLDFDCPLEAIRAVEIGMQSGEDGWHLAEFAYQIEMEERKSRPVPVPVNRWISGSAQDGHRKAQRFLVFPARPPVFPREHENGGASNPETRDDGR